MLLNPPSLICCTMNQSLFCGALWMIHWPYLAKLVSKLHLIAAGLLSRSLWSKYRIHQVIAISVNTLLFFILKSSKWMSYRATHPLTQKRFFTPSRWCKEPWKPWHYNNNYICSYHIFTVPFPLSLHWEFNNCSFCSVLPGNNLLICGLSCFRYTSSILAL